MNIAAYDKVKGTDRFKLVAVNADTVAMSIALFDPHTGEVQPASVEFVSIKLLKDQRIKMADDLAAIDALIADAEKAVTTK